MIRRDLHDGWTLEVLKGDVPPALVGLSIPATVPGVVHTDLLAAGLIDDPLAGSNESTQLWIGQATWRYRTTFMWCDDGHERHDIVFDGLDTVASIRLNGTALGKTRNQHRTYRFDARPQLRSGENELVVEFSSAHEYIDAETQRLGARPKIYPHAFAMIRKSACNFGWDWGPDVTTAGIWRPVRLESWSGVRISAVRPSADSGGDVRVAVELERTDLANAVSVDVAIAGVSVRMPLTDAGVIELRVDEPLLWWPRGLGDSNLYELTVAAGNDHWLGHVGFRTIRVDSDRDADGRPFDVYVNDTLIRLHGANWIPDDVFPSRLTRAQCERALQDAADAHMNTIRVWGGGIYESDTFYELCDSMGLLVWQDFLFACAAYPEEEPLWSEVTAEVTDAVNRLAHHPSLMLWNGSNENMWGMSEWGWNAVIGDKSWGERYYTELLPSLIAGLDPTRQYIPSSPFSWEAEDQNAPDDGLSHLWDVWNSLDYAHYGDTMPRFVSEFGLQGAACERTLLDALDERPLSPFFGQLASHQKALGGLVKMERSYSAHLPTPTSATEWIGVTQLNQAQGLRYSIATFRTQTVSCGGILIWQLNDCWPAISWSLVDSAGRRKLAWFAVRDAFLPTTTVLGERELVLVNDGRDASCVSARVRRFTLDGALLAESGCELSADAGSRDRVRLSDEFLRTPEAGGIVVLDGPFGRSYRLDHEIRDSDLRMPEFTVTTEAHPEGVSVRVSADTVVVDLSVQADLLAARATADTALVTLLPGETHTFVIRGVMSPSDEEVRRAITCANTLVALPAALMAS